jgi:hypothetical protein
MPFLLNVALLLGETMPARCYNVISENLVRGIFNETTEQNTGSPAPGYGPGDNLIAENVIALNGGDGIRNVGSSPTIVDNIIANNANSGVRN